VVIVAFVLATEVDSVYQGHAPFLVRLNVDQIFYQLEGVWLGELLENEGRLLWVLVEHFIHESTAHDAYEWLGSAVLLKQQVNFLDV